MPEHRYLAAHLLPFLDADPDSTRTPYVAWGSGIRSPLPDSTPSSHDKVSHPWQFTDLLRRDVDQVDLTMLMAALIGGDWPKNSVGILPDDLIRSTSETRARLMLGNARSAMEQFETKQSGQLPFEISVVPSLNEIVPTNRPNCSSKIALSPIHRVA